MTKYYYIFEVKNGHHTGKAWLPITRQEIEKLYYNQTDNPIENYWAHSTSDLLRMMQDASMIYHADSVAKLKEEIKFSKIINGNEILKRFE